MRRYPKVRKKLHYVMYDERGLKKRRMEPMPFFRPAYEKTFEYRLRILQAQVQDSMLQVVEPLWKFIKKRPRLLWLYEKCEPVLAAISWFIPFHWEKR